MRAAQLPDWTDESRQLQVGEKRLKQSNQVHWTDSRYTRPLSLYGRSLPDTKTNTPIKENKDHAVKRFAFPENCATFVVLRATI